MYQRRVFFVRLLGLVTPSAARRIGYADALVFERIHEQVCAEHGFELVDVPPGPVAARVRLVAGYADPAGYAGAVCGRVSPGATGSPQSSQTS